MMGIMNNMMAQQQAAANAYANAAATQATEKPAEKTDGWKCPMCGATNTGKFCTECGSVGPDFG